VPNLLIKNGIILTVDRSRRVIWDGAIFVENGRISDVGKTEDVKTKHTAEIEIDARNKLISPGLINTHTHLFGSFARGLVENLEFMPWCEKKLRLTHLVLDKENYYISSLFLAMEMIKTGTTCLVDCGTVPGLEESAATAVRDVGVRAVLGRNVADVYNPPLTTFPVYLRKSTDQQVSEVESFVKKWNNQAGGRISAWVCPIQTPCVSDNLWREAFRIANTYDVGVLTHAGVDPQDVNETVKNFGSRAMERLYNLGVLGPRLLAAHMGHVSDKEVSYLEEKGGNVSHCPAASMHLAYGASQGRIPEMMDVGINVGLGSDGPAAGNFQDMVRVMHLAATCHKEARRNCSIVQPETVVEMATINNAKAIQREHEIGSIEIGKKADLVIFNTNMPQWRPLNKLNVVRNLVYSSSGDSAETVIIDGSIVMEKGKLLTVNEQEVLEKTQKYSEKMLQVDLKEFPEEPVWPQI